MRSNENTGKYLYSDMQDEVTSCLETVYNSAKAINVPQFAFLASAPASPAAGDTYIKTGDAKIYTYDGTSWDTGATVPLSSLAYDTVSNKLKIKAGSAWETITST